MSAYRRYYLWNIGCQMNRADAYRVGEALEARGYRPTNQPEAADLLILNTCVVRQSAEDKAVGRLSSLSAIKRRSPERGLIVMGCLVDDPDAMMLRFPYVDAFLKPSDVQGVLDFVTAWEAERGCASSVDDELQAGGDAGAPQRTTSNQQPATSPVTAVEVADLVPISYGCDHHCTYCIVTIRRGPQRSRSISEIVADAERLVARGAREITLLGQNVDAYGADLPDHPDLADVLAAVHEIDGLWRLRFLTSHPKDMTQRIIETVARLPKVCACWELAVQSGDDAVLRRMARGYDMAHFHDLVGRIRAAMPDGALNTDIIVGFPGETVAQFENTRRLIEEVRFDMVHVAAYSVRPGTPAARLEDDVPPEEKERRRALIEGLQEQIAGEINARLLGQEVEILIDGRQRGRWRGRTRTNKLVFFESGEDWLGRLAHVRITWTGAWSMLGEIVGD